MIRRLGRRLLLEVADFAVFHPRSVLIVSLLVAALAATTITDLHLKTDVEDLLPRDAEGIREYLEAMEAHGEADQLYLILRGEGESDADLRTHLTEAIVRRLEELWRAGGDDELLLGRIEEVRLGPDGNLYLMDQQLSQVLVLSPDGEYMRTLSREGEGPGEVRRPAGMLFMPDGNLGLLQPFRRPWVATPGSPRRQRRAGPPR